MMLLAAVLACPVFGQSYTPTYGKVPRYDHTATERYYGLRFGCGFEYQRLYAEAGVEFGLVDFSKDDFSAARNQNVFLNSA